ncbi:hypothetical protein KKA14_19980, partial [bacterium]|nr:hypothetical protein [bacterium]
EDVVPFNFWIWKDIATGFQLAAFWETGSVAEEKKDLGIETRSTYGLGFRVVSASGSVYRMDQAFGNEGAEFIMIVSYPW